MREVDALGGLMGVAADISGIQFRLLNKSKGPAQGPRTQSDRSLYKNAVQNIHFPIRISQLLRVKPPICTSKWCCCGIELEDGTTLAEVVVLTTGTFLNGQSNWRGKS